MNTSHDVVEFWRQSGPGAWFSKNPEFDRRFRRRFSALHLAASRRELDHWAGSPEGALALLILLDQFPRNAFRGSAHMYATDALALRVARQMIEAGFDKRVDRELRPFCYLPFAHSENLDDQRISVEFNQPLGSPWIDHAREHQQIIERFGRFPHRNAMFGRDATSEERRFLADGGFAG